MSNEFDEYLELVLSLVDSINKTKVDHKKQEDCDIKKIQEQLSNKSFTKMCFSTNTTKAKRFNPETGYSYEIKQHDKLTNLLYKDVLFNRFIAKCVQLTCEDEETLVEMFAEFLTMMSDCENRKQTSTKNIFDDVLKLDNQFLKNEILKEIKNELDKIIDNNK